ncbi:hypothetical protein HA402_005276 [Bradysia odoriphaga]|nr:hypothetical protein HA402_005276 [Bradysia odoriphaga]
MSTKPVRSSSKTTNILYKNCFLQAPDGELLISVGRKKGEWFIKKSLGTLVTDSPYTVRLNFEPEGRIRGDVGDFFKLPKLNQCVVCGGSESLNPLYRKKDRIPEERKQFFEQELLKYYLPGTEVTEQLLLDAMETQTGEINADYILHGAKVVEFYKNRDGGLIMLENVWREHFVKTMQPKYLPNLWSLNHTTERLT